MRFWTACACALILCGCRSCERGAPPAAGTGESSRASAPVAAPVEAGARWRPVSFGGAGNFLSVVADPRKPEVVYAASDVAGVFRSEDGGKSWRMRSRGLGNYEISSLAIDPHEEETLYAGVGAFPAAHKAGLYRSRDGGRSWSPLPASQRSGISFRKYRTASAIAPDPRTKGTLLVGSAAAGLFRTTDGGATFTRVLAAPRTSATLEMEDGQDEVKPPYPAPVAAVAFAPEKDGVVYTALFGAGVARSEKGGEAGSFRFVNQGLPAAPTLKGLAVGRGGLLYAALGKAGVYRSQDGGAGWRSTNRGLPLEHGWVSSIAIHPGDAKRIYLTLASYDAANVWRSEDGGESWKPESEVRHDERQDATRRWARERTLTWWVGIDPRPGSRRLWNANYWGLKRSEDGGESWDDAVVGAPNTCVTGLALTRDGALLASHMDAGLLATRDRGDSWRALVPDRYDKRFAGHVWRVIAAGSGAGQAVFATLDPWDEKKSKVLRSKDGVRFEVVLEVPRAEPAWAEGGMVGLAADREGKTIYVAADGGPLRVSRDGGARWRACEGQPDDRSYTGALAVSASGHVYAGTLRSGLFVSRDGCRSWRRSLEGHDTVWQVAAAGDTVYASSGNDANLHSTRDGGATWTRLTRFEKKETGDEVGDQGMAIAIDPKDPKHLVFSRLDTFHSADASAGLLESTDGGATWKDANEDLGLTSVKQLLIGPDGTVYAGSWCGGVWRRDPPSGK